MTKPAFLFLRYAGEGKFESTTGFMADRADREYKAGELYRLAVHEERSMKSHDHFFVVIHEMWMNLPERFNGEIWAGDEVLFRKHALIMSGWYSVEIWTLATHKEANRTANVARSMVLKGLRGKPDDEYAVVAVDPKKATVSVFRPRSQSITSMTKEDFQASKDAVFQWIEEHTGLRAEDFKKETLPNAR